MRRPTRKQLVLIDLQTRANHWVPGMDLMNQYVGGTRAGARIQSCAARATPSSAAPRAAARWTIPLRRHPAAGLRATMRRLVGLVGMVVALSFLNTPPLGRLVTPSPSPGTPHRHRRLHHLWRGHRQNVARSRRRAQRLPVALEELPGHPHLLAADRADHHRDAGHVLRLLHRHAHERIVDLDPSMVRALGLDPADGLWPVDVQPVGGLPDTAMR